MLENLNARTKNHLANITNFGKYLPNKMEY